MAVRRNADPSARLRVTTSQPIAVPGKMRLVFDCLADNDPEMASVEYSIQPKAPAKFDGANGPSAQVVVRDLSGDDVEPTSKSGDLVKVALGERTVVYDADIVDDPGPPHAPIVRVQARVTQNGVLRFTEVVQVALAVGGDDGKGTSKKKPAKAAMIKKHSHKKLKPKPDKS